MPPSQKPSILIAHPWIGSGGSEATAMWTLQALQDRAAVTLTTASLVDFDRLNRIYGTQVSPEKITFQPAPRFLGANSGSRLAYWQRAFFERFCARLSSRFDLCISAYNPIQFNCPAMQLIGDFSFNENCRLELYPTASQRVTHRRSLMRTVYLMVGHLIAGHREYSLGSKTDWIVANSNWTASQLKRSFDLSDIFVLYPPAIYCEANVNAVRDPLGFICMGRVSPEKELETIIHILDKVRNAGYPVTLDILGSFGNCSYAQKIQKMVEQRREWIRTPGFLNPDEKCGLFSRRTFGLHACRVEAFGIAVAEMAAAGVIPFVPSSGGVGEVVADGSLVYTDEEDAVCKIIARIKNSQTLPELREAVVKRALCFRPETFVSELTTIVQSCLGASRPLS